MTIEKETTRLVLDFGSCQTRLAWRGPLPALASAGPFRQWARQVTGGPHAPADWMFWSLPSLIHFSPDGARMIGYQVADDPHLAVSPFTFPWMQPLVRTHASCRIQSGAFSLSWLEAGREFLSGLLAAFRPPVGDVGDVLFTLPVEAYEHYVQWLTTLARTAGFRHAWRLDHATTTLLSEPDLLRAGELILIVEFGGTTLDAAVVEVESEAPLSLRVLGKAGENMGGRDVDLWLYQETLRRANLREGYQVVRQSGRRLMLECERLKQVLSSRGEAVLDVETPEPDLRLGLSLDRAEFDALLQQQELDIRLQRTIRLALRRAGETGFRERDLTQVLLTGEASRIPFVRKTVAALFSPGMLSVRNTLPAGLVGAVRLLDGGVVHDHCPHDYQVRYLDADSGDYQNVTIIRRGTPFPTPRPVFSLTLKAVRDRQGRMGVNLLELGDLSRATRQVTLGFDTGGALQTRELAPEDSRRLMVRNLNGKNVLFLEAAPPIRKGEPRFRIDFGLDARCRLALTVRDLRTGNTIMDAMPAIRLG